MALHDVDKHNNDRTSPAVNAHDSQNVAARMAHGTNSINYTTDATDQTKIDGILGGILRPIITGRTSLITTDSDLIQSIDIAHGLTAIPAVMVFAQMPSSSNFGPFTIYPVYGNGFVGLPAIISTIQSVDKGGGSSNVDTTLNLLYVSYEVDGTNLTLRAQQTTAGLSSSSNTINFRYYIFQQKANY